MILTKKNFTLGTGALALAFIMTASAHALESIVFLDASQTATLQSEASSSVKLSAEASGTQSVNEAQVNTNTSTSGGRLLNVNSFDSNAWNNVWAYLGVGTNTERSTSSRTNFWENLMNFFGTTFDFTASSSVSASSARGEITAKAFEMVRVQDVASTDATVSWSPSVFSNIKVYYSTTTPVIVATTTANTSPLRFWNRSRVTLKGLTPDTTYFYKVVAETDSGTTSTTEASFKTVLK